MLFYEPDRRDRAILPHDPFKAVIAPRPIGWLSTSRAGEFVWNMPTWELREAMNQTSATCPREVDEFAAAALETAPSRLVAPPDERYIVDGIADTAAMRPIARCGHRGDYTVVDELFEMLRPA